MVLALGFLAQGFFFGRTLFQWIMSEKAKKVVSPAIFWVFSIVGSYLMFLYGWLRSDFAIILGQFISYYIYIWNLDKKGIWRKIPVIFKVLLFLTPLAALIMVFGDADIFLQEFFQNENIPVWLLVFGSVGQVVFGLRFVYQWFYSYKHDESLLPVGFWIISIVGSGMIVAYGIMRGDPVLTLGQAVGFIVYGRNIFIHFKYRKLDRYEA